MMDAGAFAEAGEYFIDYWVRSGTWKRMTEDRKKAFTAGMCAASPEWHASFHDKTPLSAFAAMDVPTLLLSGGGSTVPARTITALLSSVIPHGKMENLEGIGHMGPVTHPEIVNSRIEAFLIGIPTA